jgi:hypothetical protein
MPITQMGVVTNRRRRRDQVAELNARQTLLPQIIANQQRAEDLERQIQLQDLQAKQWEKDYNLAKQAQRSQQRANRIGMGMEAAKLGVNINQQYGGKNLSQFSTNLFGSKTTGGSAAGGAAAKGAGAIGTGGVLGFAKSVPYGTVLGSGLAGYGASRFVDKKKKGARVALGAGSGALLGLLSGGPSGALYGGISGGIGSLF